MSKAKSENPPARDPGGDVSQDKKFADAIESILKEVNAWDTYKEETREFQTYNSGPIVALDPEQHLINEGILQRPASEIAKEWMALASAAAIDDYMLKIPICDEHDTDPPKPKPIPQAPKGISQEKWDEMMDKAAAISGSMEEGY